jgi:hypothetical protein
MSNNQWVEIVAKLTLARSILATAILDIDNAVCDIDAGRLSLSKESAKILTAMIQNLTINSDDIGDIAVYIPDVFLQLDRKISQSSTQTGFLDWNHLADGITSANGLNTKAS